ncbi:MAG: CAP domain-containing protein [Candidatus Cellulosilyticum pullistercoris]|uniref:CAP domain-containing protein n=1 Tax=Candidatus Cellulosilyticum pullistercoris TaxID=2838521 RepID=A0A9E2KCL7_9FIRM|nr:CAP domain-containing protein [Candidatus Cellulosilyticum pullistercoris]
MIKSKLIMVISSIGLVATLGVGGIFLSSNGEISKDNTVKTEEKEVASNESDMEDGNNADTDNNIITEQVNSNKESPNDEVANNDDNISSNNDNVVGSNSDSDNSAEEVESEVEGISKDRPTNRPSYNKPSYNRPSYNKPSTDTNTPSDTPSQDTNTPSETPSDEPVVSDSNYIAEIEQAIFQRVNQERAASGLPALSYNTTMEHYARIKSKDMGDNGYFSHEDLQGKLITEQMKADGVSYRAWGENIAYIQGMSDNNALATKFMDNWMNSSGHRANILSTNFSSIGIGVYKIGNTYYATQEFYR